jgi:hypothetical protein
VVVHRADIQDREGVPLLLEAVKGHFPRLEKVWVDNGYTGTGRIWIKEQLGSSVVVVSHPRRPRGMWVWPGMEITPEMLAADPAPTWFSSFAPQMGGGAYTGLDWPLSPHEQGLRVSDEQQ